MKKKVVVALVICTIVMTSINLIGCNSDLRQKDEPTKEVETSTVVDEESNKDKIDKLNNILNDKYMILANKDNLLGADYIPEDLVNSEIQFQEYIVTRELDRLVASKALEMFEDAKKEGITLLGASGYRSYSIQLNMYNSRVAEIGKEAAEEYLAPPGASEHQTGYALDILSSDYPALDEGFENTEAAKWLFENSSKYGFILRYPKDKVSITKYEYEPWHYRYVGEEAAKVIMENDMCLEEYIESIKVEIERYKTVE